MARAEKESESEEASRLREELRVLRRHTEAMHRLGERRAMARLDRESREWEEWLKAKEEKIQEEKEKLKEKIKEMTWARKRG